MKYSQNISYLCLLITESVMDCLKMNFSSKNRLPRISIGEEQIDQCLTGFNSRYTFSAKEKDKGFVIKGDYASGRDKIV